MVTDGKLELTNPHSGHYLPTPEDFDRCCDEFSEQRRVYGQCRAWGAAGRQGVTRRGGAAGGGEGGGEGEGEGGEGGGVERKAD